MSDSLSKLIQLSQKHQLPLIVHDAQSGTDAVVLGLEQYEKMVAMSEECCQNQCEDDECEEFDEELEAVLKEELESIRQEASMEEMVVSKKNGESFSAQSISNQDVSLPSETVFEPWEPPQSFSKNEEVTEGAPLWDEYDFTPLNEQSVKAAHDFHVERLAAATEVEKTEEFQYEPSPGNALFPSFHTPEPAEDDDEPIFFEEPV